MNFKNMPGGSDGGGRPPFGNLPSLARQPSLYSLTFDEIQNTLGGAGKDFGSMNMDDFLKSIWTAEETQAMAAAFGTIDGEAASVGGGMPLQRQGSLTLPRTLSQKTVDEVWRDIFREGGGKDANGNSGANLQQRQQTRGEITLEEFLVRAGVVREDIQQTPAVRPIDSGFYGELPRSNNNAGLGLVFQQPGRSNGIMGNRGPENYHQIPPNQSPNLAMNVNGIRTSQHQLFQKQANAGYASSMQLGNNTSSMQLGNNTSSMQLGNNTSTMQLGNHVESGNQGVRSGIMGLGGPTVNNGFVQGGGGGGGGGAQGGGMGMVGLGAGGVTVAMESPGNQLSSDGLGKGNGDTSSLSPVPYAFNGGLRGRKCSGAVEKVVERRQRRMIKNRESAARSRARKQAYTMELEAEVAKLKEENNELQKKQLLQAQIMEMQKNQVLEMINQQCSPKKRCLRRTLTGPW